MYGWIERIESIPVSHLLHLPFSRYNLVNQTFLIAIQFFYQLLFLCNQLVNLGALGVKVVSNFCLLRCRRQNGGKIIKCI